MSFTLQFILSVALSVAAWVLFIRYMMKQVESDTLSEQIESCGYCSNVAFTTLYDEDIEEEFHVCEDHLGEFIGNV